MGKNPSDFKGDSRPVEQVSWHDCQSFCLRLAGRTGRRFRLPTEAEWEYACRAGTTTPFHFGEALSPEVANYGARQETTPGGTYPANPWGLFDVHGNVWEWCSDWYDPWYYTDGPAADPPGPRAGDTRVIRGGSWRTPEDRCQASARGWVAPGFKDNDIGFRVVLCPPDG
jgi:formylglycine-generating enzyme required for sulfatase activity